MQTFSLILVAYSFSATQTALAVPLALPQGTGTGADSCPSDPLSTATWTSLNLDTFLNDWTAANVTVTPTNNVQSLADSFGAPNFFCGLDNFCNAGQPCLPVEIPAWYVMVAIQNWNSYMNSINTAISFASSIAGLELPGVVNDFFPDPEDNVTPLANFGKMFSTILGVVPAVGPVASTIVNAGKTSVNLAVALVKPPAQTDKFVQWSNIATSLASTLTDYQASVSTSIKATLDAPVNQTDTGINSVIAGGTFLGASQNFTQTDLQSVVSTAVKTYAISLIFQAKKVFLLRSSTTGGCKTYNSAYFCGPDGTSYILLRNDGNGNSEPQIDEIGLLKSKYGFTDQTIFLGPTACFDANNKVQLTDPFVNGALPLDMNGQCLFNVLICDEDGAAFEPREGIVDFCKRVHGLDI